MKNVLFTIIALLITASSQAQVLSTADTLGKSKNLLAVSENNLEDAGVGINIAYLQYIRGVSPNFDLYLSVGQTDLFDESQQWIGLGWNAHLLSVKGVSVSFYTNTTIPLSNSQIGSAVLVNPAIVVSHSVNSRLTFYIGVNALVPIGSQSSRFFTPMTTKVNVPIGASIVFGNWGLVEEVDLGKLKAVGVALSRTF
jgi:hypothetical protein